MIFRLLLHLDAPLLFVPPPPEKLVLKFKADESSLILLIDLWVFLAAGTFDDDIEDVFEDDDELVGIDLDDGAGFVVGRLLLPMVIILPLESSIVSCVCSSFDGSVFSFFRRTRVSLLNGL